MSQESLPYLEERKLVKRWSGPWPALVNLVFTLIIFAILALLLLVNFVSGIGNRGKRKKEAIS